MASEKAGSIQSTLKQCIMATKIETNNTGLKKDKSEDTYRELTSVVRKNKNEEKKQDKDAEAGIDSAEDQINDLPNDPEAKIPEKKD